MSTDTTTSRGPQPIASLRGVSAYRVPVAGAPTDLKLDANEGPAPDPAMLEAVAKMDAAALRFYPSKAAVETSLAERLGVDPSQVLLTNGGDEAIDRVMRAFAAPGSTVVQTEPTFEMIARSAELSSAKVTSVPWREGPLPLQELLEASPDPTVLAVVTPNNPTGSVATADDLRTLSEARPNTLLLIDLAYNEFATEDLMPAALELPNAVIIRTMSKAWGLAGVRLGYAVSGSAALIEPLRAAGGPYAVSGPNIAIAAAALEAGDNAGYLEQVKAERVQLRQALADLGCPAPKSEANFVLARASTPERAVWIRDGMAGMGIAVRAYPDKPLLQRDVRVTCPGNAADFARLTSALRTTLNPEAILFDMDGVLADVSQSYRTAMIDTAASFGVTVTREDLAIEKAKGNANNDWVVTHRLVEAAGVAATLQEVTDRFEELYQGTEDNPGLRSTESLLCDRALIERLAARMPLAIVTGRPRGDARRFLEEKSIAEFFQTTVAMEDGPLKPDPAPIRSAMATLGVTHAWMIGDTVDDARSARSAGALPLGVIPPTENLDTTGPNLIAAGCARVLGSLDDLEGLLP